MPPVICPTCGRPIPEGMSKCPKCTPTIVRGKARPKGDSPEDLKGFPKIAGYRPLSKIGEGGMGDVYLAEETQLGRRVAIKCISEKFASEIDARARFLREARIMATVEHPHVVRIYSLGESGGTVYLVMQYVEGENVGQYLERVGKLPLDEALRITRETAEALEAAWERGIVHRDIKPANLLLDSRGRVHVADFGLAKSTQWIGDGSISHGGFFGTPHYLAPEQARGEPVGFRCDVYSLGIVLFEMLAGEPPFQRPTPLAIVADHLNTPLPSLRAWRPDTPADVVRLVEQMTEKNPAKRPASHAAVRQAIAESLVPYLAWEPSPGGSSPDAFERQTPNPSARMRQSGVRRKSGKKPMPMSFEESADRVIEELRELNALTSTESGAQRVAWGPVWRQAREWFTNKVEALGLGVTADAAGNNWVTLGGGSMKTVIIGGHLDSVPNGGWLDGCLGVLTGLEALRRHIDDDAPATLRLVDWADEEGARFSRSLLGSSAASGSLNVDEIRHLVDRQGTPLVQAMAENGVDIDHMREAKHQLQAIDARAYLELHIEQGPVLESMGKSTGVVLGTFGVERHSLRFMGQAAHSGSTPIAMRRDAFLAAASFALRCRDIAKRYTRPGMSAVCTVGVVKVEPCIVTAVPGVCEVSLDQRALEPEVLASMLAEAHEAAATSASENDVVVQWSPIWRIEPRPFDPTLIQLCEAAVREVCGAAPRLPSGPLHDAAEMVPHMPVVMMFAKSSRGLSHCKEEDTPHEDLRLTIQAFLRLVDSTTAHVGRG